MTVPIIYQSSTENIEDVILTDGSSYIYWSPYSIVVPGLCPADVVHVTGRAEVTNMFGFPVMVGWFLSTEGCYGGAEPPYIGPPPAAQDLSLGQNQSGQCHLVCSVNAWVTGFTGDIDFALIMYAASADMTAGQNYLVLEKGYGLIQAAVFKSS